MRNIRRMIGALMVAALTLLGITAVGLPAVHVQAASPTREVFSADSSFTALPGEMFNPCSQPLSVVVTGNVYLTDYYDQSGNLVRELVRTPQLTFTVTGPNGNSLTALSPAPGHLYVTSATLTLVDTGQQIRFTIPGSGSVIAVAGQETIVVDLTTGDVTDTFNGESVTNASAYCTYLGAT